MAKLPYIPLYIGDWEQDTNEISLLAEGALLKITFKWHKAPVKGVYKTDTKGLQNLWRISVIEIEEIIREFLRANSGEGICKVVRSGEDITFISRRHEHEKKISKIRSDAVQNRYKNDTNDLLKRDIDNEYDNDNETDNENKNDVEVLESYPFDLFWDSYDKKVDREKCEKKWNKLSDKDKEAILQYIPKYREAQPNKQYRKNPETFFNNRSWENEIISSSNGKQSAISKTELATDAYRILQQRKKRGV